MCENDHSGFGRREIIEGVSFPISMTEVFMEYLFLEVNKHLTNIHKDFSV